MSILVPALENVAPASQLRNTKRRVVRGRTRGVLRKLREKLLVCQRIDAREEARATELGYNPVLIKKSTNSAEDRAIQRVISRCEELLALVY